MSTRSVCFCLSLELGKVLVRPVIYFIINLSEHAGVPGAWAFTYCLHLAENEIDLREVMGLFQGSRGNYKSNLTWVCEFQAQVSFSKSSHQRGGFILKWLHLYLNTDSAPAPTLSTTLMLLSAKSVLFLRVVEESNIVSGKMFCL